MTIESAMVRKVATIDEHRSCVDAAQVMTRKVVGALVITRGFRDQRHCYREGLDDESGCKGSTSKR